MTDWKQIREEYIAGGVSYRALAERHGVPLGTLSKVACKEGWTELQKRKECPAKEPGQFSESTDVTAIADKLLLRVSELLDIMALDTQGLKQLASVLKDIRDIKESPLESALQRARLQKLEREAEIIEDGPSEIEIVFKAGKEDWNE